MTLGEKIKELRTRQGITQETFAEHLNVSRSAVAKWESDIGVPEIVNLKAIAKTFGISIDELLNEEDDLAENEEFCKNIAQETSETGNAYAGTKYADFYCDIELNGWNDGVTDAVICGEDEDFLYYQRAEKKNVLYGLIGKKYITSVIKTKKTPELIRPEIISRNYFLNKPVCVEVAHKKGLLKGFFDFSNDDYLNVTINTFREGKVYLEFGRTLDVDDITKIEEIPA